MSDWTDRLVIALIGLIGALVVFFVIASLQESAACKAKGGTMVEVDSVIVMMTYDGKTFVPQVFPVLECRYMQQKTEQGSG